MSYRILRPWSGYRIGALLSAEEISRQYRLDFTNRLWRRGLGLGLAAVLLVTYGLAQCVLYDDLGIMLRGFSYLILGVYIYTFAWNTLGTLSVRFSAGEILQALMDRGIIADSDSVIEKHAI